MVSMPSASFVRLSSSSIIAGLVLALTACNSPPSSQQPSQPPANTEKLDLKGARSALADALSEAASNPAPTNAEALARQLNLPAARVGAFQTGDKPSAVAAAFRAGYLCAPGICICDGDDDCNNLFSGVCRSPSTGGQCWVNGSRVVCVCHPRAVQ